jgi:hypothetical protein
VNSSKVHLLIATIPSRREACTKLLESIKLQTKQPDLVHLVLDGYGDQPAPPCDLPSKQYRTASLSGPGGRWRVVKDIDTEAILISIDDDIEIANDGKDLISMLVHEVEETGHCVALIGVTVSGEFGNMPTTEDLICVDAKVMACRAGDLHGVSRLVAEVREKCGFDPVGDCGDDEAVVSAHLWREGVRMRRVFFPQIRLADGTQVGSQTEKRRATGKPLWWQRHEVARITGWPFRDPTPKSELHVIVPNIVSRKSACEKVLYDLTQQTRVPDLVHLVLDGYGDLSAPQVPVGLKVKEWRTPELSGCGARWRVARDLDPEVILANVDDDIDLKDAPETLESLVFFAEKGFVASTYGVTISGKHGNIEMDEFLVSAAAGTMATKVKNLHGVEDLLEKVRSECGFDPFGRGGDDDGLLSAHFWQHGVQMVLVSIPAIGQIKGTQDESETKRRRVAEKADPFRQRREIARIVGGWPFLGMGK